MHYLIIRDNKADTTTVQAPFTGTCSSPQGASLNSAPDIKDATESTQVHAQSTLFAAVDRCITSALTLDGLVRGQPLVIGEGPIANLDLPTLPLALTSVFHRRSAQHDNFGTKVIKESSQKTLISLEPTVSGYFIDEKGDPYPQVSTIAQEFIRHPCKSWWNNESPDPHWGTTLP